MVAGFPRMEKTPLSVDRIKLGLARIAIAIDPFLRLPRPALQAANVLM
jgi:hypothetical protein